MPRTFMFVMVLTFFGVCPAIAQPQSGSAPSQAAATASTQDAASSGDATKKPKRVWTNDDIPASKAAANSNADVKIKPPQGGAKPANAAYVESVKKQIAKYQGQITDIDKQLTDLKNFSEGEPSTRSSGVKLNKSMEREPIEVQMRALQDQKKDLLAKIDSLLDEARKKGVEPGDLR